MTANAKWCMTDVQVNERECALKKRTLSLVCEVHGEWQCSVKTFSFSPQNALFLFIVTACFFVPCVSVCRFTPRLLFFRWSCTHTLYSACEDKTWQGWWFFSATSKAFIRMHVCCFSCGHTKNYRSTKQMNTDRFTYHRNESPGNSRQVHGQNKSIDNKRKKRQTARLV